MKYLSYPFSFSHSASKAIPRSKQDISELAGAVLFGDQAHYRVLKLPINVTQNPTRKRAEIRTVKDNAITRNVIPPRGIVIAEMESVAQDVFGRGIAWNVQQGSLL